MPNFISVDGSKWINLDHVSEVTQRYSRETKIQTTTFFDSDGKRLGETKRHEGNFALEEVLAPIVPAVPGAEAYRVFILAEDREARPVASDLFVDRNNILFWRATTPPTPVFSEELSNAIILIIEADGRLVHQFNGEHKDLEAAKADILGQAQRDWDDKHGAASAPAAP